MKILITGGEGFIGSRLRDKIATESPFALDFDQLEIVSWDTKSRDPMTGGDLTDMAPDIIVNLAATLWGTDEEDFTNDLLVTSMVGFWCYDEGTPLLHTSSIASASPDIDAYSYAHRKRSQERVLLDLDLEDKCAFTCVRLNNVYGVGQARPALFAEMEWAHATETPLQIHGGHQIRSWINVDDVCDKIIEWIGAAPGLAPALVMEEWTGADLSVFAFVRHMETLHHLECRAIVDHEDHGTDEPPVSNYEWEPVLVGGGLVK